MHERIDEIESSSTIDIDSNNDDDNNINVERNDKSWFCIFCNKTHFARDECPQKIFGEGDKYCDLCSKVHYNNAECPKGGKWCFYCGGLYTDEQEHFGIHERDDIYNHFIKENPSWANPKMPSWAIDRVLRYDRRTRKKEEEEEDMTHGNSSSNNNNNNNGNGSNSTSSTSGTYFELPSIEEIEEMDRQRPL
jgi:hypothetical protein